MNVVRWTFAVAVLALSASPAMAQQAVQAAFNYNLMGSDAARQEPSSEVDSRCQPEGYYDTGCCDSGVCEYGCCDVGCCDPCADPDCSLQSLLTPDCAWNYGGWAQVGYHTEETRQSIAPDDVLAFNDLPDQINLHQGWFYMEKAAGGTSNTMDWGFRADMMYGTDAQKTQAFGNPRALTRNRGTWDASLDHGSYGWAIPQLYAEVAMGNLSIKAGHFYTLIGYEVVTAPDNFFYSHAYTMFNSEPFTHTGVLASLSAGDDTTLYGGWTLGWDTGFDQYFGGSNFLGGFSQGMGDDVTFTYICTAGNFGMRSAGTDGYSHSCVFDVNLSNNLNYVLQSDYVVHEDGSFETLGVKTEDVGINQYLFYTMNDYVSAGCRCEWWKSAGFTGGNHTSYYGLTGGLNIKPCGNFIVRPEVRHNWTGGDVDFAANNGGVNFNQTVFGCDCIVTF